MQRYGKFEGVVLRIVHCLGWFYLMTPVKSHGIFVQLKKMPGQGPHISKCP